MLNMPQNGILAAPPMSAPLGNSPNPLASASKNLMPDQLKTMGPNSRPAGWFISDPNKSPAIPADEPQSKFFCTAFFRKGLMSKQDYLGFCRAHIKAVFKRGDFAYWYAKNGMKLVQNAEIQGFDWSSMKELAIDRTKEIYRAEGFDAAMKNYLSFSEAMYRLFGLKDPEIEPFRSEFYFSSRSERWKGTIRVLALKPVWEDLVKNVKMQWRSYSKRGIQHGLNLH